MNMERERKRESDRLTERDREEKSEINDVFHSLVS